MWLVMVLLSGPTPKCASDIIDWFLFQTVMLFWRTMSGMQLDIESLRVLLAVLESGGFTRAAERLQMGQSAVSRKVQRLEEKAGQPLLIRDGHALRPTRAGRALLPDARAMVDLHDQAAARLQSSDLSGSVSLSCNGEIDMQQVAAVLGAFRRRHPGTEVKFAVDHSGSLVDWVDAGEVDVGIFQVADEVKRPTDIHLWTEDLVFVTSAADPFADQPIPFLDFGNCCYYNDFVHATLERAGIAFQTVFSAATSADVRAAVQAGIGVAAMSSRYLGGDVVEWRPPVPVDPLPQINNIIRAVPGERPEVVAALVETIRNELRCPDVVTA